MKKILLTFLLLMLAKPAYAYLDPGTGSILVQSIVASVAVVLVFFRTITQSIKTFWVKIFDKTESRD